MEDYKKLYFELFNGIANIIEELKLLQLKVEKEFIEDDEK